MTIISVGKKNTPWIEQGIAVYQKRLRRPFLLDWKLIPHQPVASKARSDESDRILKLIPNDHFVILLDETGRQLNSPDFSQLLQQTHLQAKSITFIIGGAYGVNQQVKTRANFVWSLSPSVFPHQLVRLILAEQIYRAQSIAFNEPYHHQ